MAIVSYDLYAEWRQSILRALPFHDFMIYSLPEGLWVFAATLSSKYFHLRIRSRDFALVFTPVVFSIGLELFQLLHLTNGRFDWWDIVISLVCWVIAFYLPIYRLKTENIFKPVSIHSLVCISVYLIVYLAHVWR